MSGCPQGLDDRPQAGWMRWGRACGSTGSWLQGQPSRFCTHRRALVGKGLCLVFSISESVTVLQNFVDMSRFSPFLSCCLYASVPILGSQDGVEIKVASVLQVQFVSLEVLLVKHELSTCCMQNTANYSPPCQGFAALPGARHLLLPASVGPAPQGRGELARQVAQTAAGLGEKSSPLLQLAGGLLPSPGPEAELIPVWS